MDLAHDTWTRRGTDVLSRQSYMALITLMTLGGLAFSGLTSTLTAGLSVKDNSLAFIGLAFGVLAASFLGMRLTFRTGNLLYSLVGYAVITGAFGLLLGPLFAMYTASSIIRVFFLTGAVVVILGIIGAAYPRDLSSWGPWLLGGLGILLVGMFGSAVFNIGGAMTLLDWAGLILFGFMLVFDFNRAARIPHTAKNAVDSSVAIYLDFINIFIRLLSIMGVKAD